MYRTHVRNQLLSSPHHILYVHYTLYIQSAMVPGGGGGLVYVTQQPIRHVTTPHPLINPRITHLNNDHAALISASKGWKGHRLSPIS